MLVWINGPFGGGKTQVAHEIARRLPGSVVCDPEEVGYGLHRTVPRALRGDFQDLRAWRVGVVEALELVLRRHPGPVLAPMTVTDPGYFDETVGALRRAGHEVRHVALLARRETVVRRLRERGIGRAGSRLLARLGGEQAPLRRESFALARLDDCLTRLREPLFAEQVWTDERSVAQVADVVAGLAGLPLNPNTDSALRGKLRRGWTSAQHIRLR